MCYSCKDIQAFNCLVLCLSFPARSRFLGTRRWLAKGCASHEDTPGPDTRNEAGTHGPGAPHQGPATDMNAIQATRLRKGMLVKLGNDLFRILELHHLTPGNKRAHIQARMRNIRTMALADEKFRAEEDIERATLDEREMQYLYNDGDAYYFMDTSSFEQIHIPSEALGESVNYLVAASVIKVEFYDVEPVGIELPPTVDLVVKETVPGIKGATASAQVKPATLETGLVIQVPSFVNEGDKVRVNTDTGEYQSRA